MEYTVEQVAINAVMAGATPDMFPAILALAATHTEVHGSSSSSTAALAVFNGPIVKELDINSGTGALQATYGLRQLAHRARMEPGVGKRHRRGSAGP